MSSKESSNVNEDHRESALRKLFESDTKHTNTSSALERYKIWRQYVYDHPQEYAYKGAYEPFDPRYEFSHIRFEEIRTKLVREQNKRSTEFAKLESEQKRALDRVRAIAGPMQAARPCTTIEGKFPVKLIKYMIEKLTPMLTDLITKDMTDGKDFKFFFFLN